MSPPQSRISYWFMKKAFLDLWIREKEQGGS